MRLEYFEMIDRVVAIDREAKRIEARSTVPGESPVFEGHFPGHPLVPGVLLTETMAQASGYLVLATMDFTHMPFLMAVDKARFRTFVGPGRAACHLRPARTRGLGLCRDEGEDRGRGKADLRRRIAVQDHALPGRSRRSDARAGAAHRLALGGSMMREVVVTGIGLVSCAGEGVAAHLSALAGQSEPRVDTRNLRPLSGPSGRDAQLRQPDRQEVRPAPDGDLAAPRLLRCRARARRRRRQGRCGTQEPHASHRGGRRRRAGLRRRRADPDRASHGRRPGRLPQRAPHGRSAPDALPGPALEPLGRQHLDRPRRHRRLAHLHGRGIERRRRGARRARPHRIGPERHLPRRGRLQRRAAGRAPHLRDGRLPLEEALSPGLRAAGGGRRNDPRVAAPASSSSNRANTPRRAAQSRSPPSPGLPRTVPAVRPAASRRP